MNIALRTLFLAAVTFLAAALAQQQVPPAAPAAPNPDMHYQIGPDSFPRDGVPLKTMCSSRCAMPVSP